MTRRQVGGHTIVRDLLVQQGRCAVSGGGAGGGEMAPGHLVVRSNVAVGQTARRRRNGLKSEVNVALDLFTLAIQTLLGPGPHWLAMYGHTNLDDKYQQ